VAVKIVSGIPGSGKTLYTVMLAKKHFLKQNNFIKKIIRKIKKEPLIKNTVYSNFPIVLDEKLKIMSQAISLWQLNTDNRLKEHSFIALDEIQLYIDSDEYINKAMTERFRLIANYLQKHRHYIIDDIVITSQHPARVTKKIRNICSHYEYINNFFKFPLLPFGFYHTITYYNVDDYLKSWHIDRKLSTYDFTISWGFCSIKKYYKSYNTIYFNAEIKDKPLLDAKEFESIYLTLEEIKNNF